MTADDVKRELSNQVGRKQKTETERPHGWKDKNRKKERSRRGGHIQQQVPRVPKLTPRHIHPAFIRWTQCSAFIFISAPRKKERVTVSSPILMVAVAAATSRFQGWWHLHPMLVVPTVTSMPSRSNGSLPDLLLQPSGSPGK